MARNTNRTSRAAAKAAQDAAANAEAAGAHEQDADTPDVQPEPDATEGNTPETDSTPDAPEQPEQPEQDAPEPDATPGTEGSEPVTETPAEDAPEPDGTEPAEDAEPATGDAPEADAEQPQADAAEPEPAPETDSGQPDTDAEPERTGGYTPAPDPDAEPVMQLEPEAAPSFATLLAVAGSVALGADTRWSALVRAGAQLVARLARTPEGEGTVVYADYRIPGPNGSGPARMNALTQILYVLGGDMVGRIITHDNTKTRPGRMRITTYAETQADVIALLEAAWPVLDIWGNAARKESAQWRRGRHMTHGTYRDNLQERSALISKGRELAQDIARATADDSLTGEEQALYRHHTARIIMNTAAPLKGERHYPATWNLPENLGGLPVPQMFAPAAPAPVTEPAAAPELAGATA